MSKRVRAEGREREKDFTGYKRVFHHKLWIYSQ